MLQFPSRRLAAAFTVAGAALALVPASASAVVVTLTDDAGVAQPWAGEPVLRNMHPTVGVAFAADERGSYNATFAGPDGAAVSNPAKCYGINIARPIDYRGNGVYSMTIQKFPEKDNTCQNPTGPPQVYRFTINGSVALTGPPTPVLIRQPNSYVTQPVMLPFAGNPGMVGPEIRYALNGVIGPDGGLAGPSNETSVDSATGQVPLRITAPGRYVAVARAKGFNTGAGQFFTPWTPPATVNAIAPFDIESTRTPDSRGPSYRIRVQIRERTASGRVSIAYARGTKGGRYRSLGSVKISSQATFTKRFRLRRSGTYRMRFKYKGSATVAPGTVVAKFRVSRRFAF